MSPSRSTNVTIENKSGGDLTLADSGLDHGEWTEGLSPPQTIASNSSGVFQAESAGVMTGDQGYVLYNLANGGQVRFDFDNPYNGSNSYDQSVPDGYAYNRSGGGGDNAYVTWVVVSI